MIPEDIRQIMEQLNTNGFQAYVVGGAVRDIVLGKDPSDFDIATDAHPDQVHSLFGEAAQSTENSRNHGTVFVSGVDVTTFRTDHDEDGRSARAEFAESILDDVGRRDFTFNGMAMLPNGEIYDPFDGQQDLEAHLVRAIGDPVQRIRESYVRMLRACRFCALHPEMRLERELHRAIERDRASIHYIPPELIRHELMKMMAYPAPMNGIDALRTTGLLQEILPELACCLGVTQEGPYHSHDVYYHALRAMSYVSQDRPLLRLAALLHDVGKPMRKTMDGEVAHFYRHQEIGATLVEALMRRLRFSNEEISYTSTLVSEHMTLVSYYAPTSFRGVRRLLVRLGNVSIEDLLILRSADRYGRMGIEREDDAGQVRIREMVAQIREEEHALRVTDLEIDGDDLIAMGLEPGPIFSQILRGLLEEVLDDPRANDRSYLLQRAREIASGS